jgi:tripartite-type tricarboxylate transporter receptor subunit TctC
MRRLAVMLVLLAAPAWATPAWAAWPDRPIRLVVPFAPAGTTDIIARQYVEFMRPRLGQPMVVENRPGAATNIGAELVARAEPDGHTLLLGAGLLLSNPIWGPKPGFDPMTALAPISMVAETQFLLAARPGFAATSPGALIAVARARPGAISVASAQLDLTIARLTRALGIELQHIGYRGGAPAMTDAIAGQVDMVVALVPVLLPAVRDGTLRPIGVTGPQRSAVLPDVPSFVGAGYLQATEVNWNALFAPAGTPVAVVERLAAETRAFAGDPALGQRLRDQGIVPRASTPAELAAFLAHEQALMRALFAEIGPVGPDR